MRRVQDLLFLGNITVLSNNKGTRNSAMNYLDDQDELFFWTDEPKLVNNWTGIGVTCKIDYWQ